MRTIVTLLLVLILIGCVFMVLAGNGEGNPVSERSDCVRRVGALADAGSISTDQAIAWVAECALNPKAH